MALESKEQRRIMGMFATGVTVISIKNGDETWGMTANAVTSLSLDPPLVLVAVEKEGKTHPIISGAGQFAVNILAEDQKEISDRYAFKGPRDFSNLDTKTAVTGSPIIEGSLGWVDCKTKEVLAGGDHDIFVGEILDGGAPESGSPLCYFGGKYAKLES